MQRGAKCSLEEPCIKFTKEDYIRHKKLISGYEDGDEPQDNEIDFLRKLKTSPLYEPEVFDMIFEHVIRNREVKKALPLTPQNIYSMSSSSLEACCNLVERGELDIHSFGYLGIERLRQEAKSNPQEWKFEKIKFAQKILSSLEMDVAPYNGAFSQKLPAEPALGTVVDNYDGVEIDIDTMGNLGQRETLDF